MKALQPRPERVERTERPEKVERRNKPFNKPKKEDKE